MAPFILHSMQFSRPYPLCRKASPKNDSWTSCFTVGMVFLGLYLSFFQTRRVKFIPKSSTFVSSYHRTFSHSFYGSSRQSWANFRWVLSCDGLSRGTLCALQDYGAGVFYWWFSIETVVPALFGSLTRSCHVGLGTSLIVLMIIDASQKGILHGLADGGRVTVILNFPPFSYNCTSSYCKLLPYCPVANPSIVQVSNVIPDVLAQLSDNSHHKEVGVLCGQVTSSNRCRLCRLWVENRRSSKRRTNRPCGSHLHPLYEEKLQLCIKYLFVPLYAVHSVSALFFCF